ncbi:MAG: hypothetical protein MUF12_06720 [Sediminibacterium sp.]|nr:hypothetical protein [Sediminibacterium sp.]
MEPGVQEFLLRIVRTLSLGLLCLALNSTFGIMYGYAFVEGSWGWANFAYYAFFFLSFGWLYWYLRKLWKNPIEFDR